MARVGPKTASSDRKWAKKSQLDEKGHSAVVVFLLIWLRQPGAELAFVTAAQLTESPEQQKPISPISGHEWGHVMIIHALNPDVISCKPLILCILFYSARARQRPIIRGTGMLEEWKGSRHPRQFASKMVKGSTLPRLLHLPHQARHHPALSLILISKVSICC